MPNDDESVNQPTDDSSQSAIEDTSNTTNEEDEKEDDDEPIFHPHKGKIMQILQYKNIPSLSFDKSYEEPTGTGKIELKFEDNDYKYIYRGVACKLKVRRDTDRQFSDTGLEEVFKKEKDIQLREHYPTSEMLLDNQNVFAEKEFISKEYKDFDVLSTLVSRSASDDALYGFVTEVTHSEKSSEISLKDWGYCLEDNKLELSFNGLLRSHLIEEVVKSYGLSPVVNLDGLEDDLVSSWTNAKTVSKGTTGGDSSTSVNGDGSMTEDQMWDIYKSFVYGGWGSGHDPQKAWDKMGTTKGAKADCYDATAWAYYVYNFKIGIPARDVCYHSDSAPSGSHHTIQIYKNGKWIDPPQLKDVKSGLGGGAKGKDFHICREPPNGDDIPPYDRCPHSNND